MKLLNLYVLVLAFLLFTACKKENTTSPAPHPVAAAGPFDGTYTGSFAIIKTADTGTAALSADVRFRLKGTILSSLTDTVINNAVYSNPGYGTFTHDNNQLTFSNSAEIVTPVQFPGIVQYSGTLLFGPYQYQVKGDSLILTKTTAANIYTYRLLRQ